MSLYTHKAALVLGTAAWLWLGIVPVSACSYVFREISVGQNFRVKVLDRGRPIAGLTIRTEASFSPSAKTVEAVTDLDGVATFANVELGKYFLSADHDGGVSDGYYVLVTPYVREDKLIKLTWPNPEPLQVKAVRGSLRLTDSDSKEFTQKPFSLSLVEAVANRVIASTETDAMGNFILPTPSPGLYFVRLNPSGVKGWDGAEITGNIPVEIRTDVATEAIDLDLAWSSCGLFYRDSAKCRQPDVTLSQLCGEIVDPSGAPISRAVIAVLKNEHDAIPVGQTVPDGKGRFSMPQITSGIYELYVKSSGFYIAHSKIQVSGKSSAAYCAHPAPIVLGVGESCSSIGGN